MVQGLVGTFRPLASVALAALVTGCALSGSSPREGETTETVLTNQGARAVLRGGPESVAESAEEVFRLLDIDLNEFSVNDRGGMIEGQAGMDRIFVELSAAGTDRTEVIVRVRTPSLDRWDRVTARGILEEIRRWQAS